MRIFFICLFVFASFCLRSQQVADTTFNPVISNPEYQKGKGSVVFIDEGHCNFHTKAGRYKPFATLLERDGYVVKEYPGDFDLQRLKKGKILVIANALNRVNEVRWFLPVPSAFKEEEIKILKQWVTDGGSLFLIADHMPFAGASKDLAAVFGFEFTNGFAVDTVDQDPAYFTLTKNTLIESIITTGRNTSENVSKVATFTGQAFKLAGDATPILVLNKNFVDYLPDTAWQINPATTKKLYAGGWSQGGYKKYGKGRVVVFGEAAMFSAQLAGPQQFRIGMNSETAGENYKLLLNIIHWLDGRL